MEKMDKPGADCCCQSPGSGLILISRVDIKGLVGGPVQLMPLHPFPLLLHATWHNLLLLSANIILFPLTTVDNFALRLLFTPVTAVDITRYTFVTSVSNTRNTLLVSVAITSNCLLISTSLREAASRGQKQKEVQKHFQQADS